MRRKRPDLTPDERAILAELLDQECLRIEHKIDVERGDMDDGERDELERQLAVRIPLLRRLKNA